MKKYLILTLFICFCSLYATNTDKGNSYKQYINFEVANNKIQSIGCGTRQIVNRHAFDWYVSVFDPYKNKDFGLFIPISLSMNYLYFFPYNTYIGLGARLKEELSKNSFSPITFNPCLTWGVLTNINEREVFIELKAHFLQLIKIISNYKDFDFSKEYKKNILKSYYLSINFGTYF